MNRQIVGITKSEITKCVDSLYSYLHIPVLNKSFILQTENSMTKLTLPNTKASRRAESNSCLAGRHPKKRGQVFMINIFSRSHKFTSHERNWDKKCWEILQNFLNDSYTKSHLALGNLANLVFCSILSIKNWICEKLPSFFLSQFHSWE